MPKRRVGVVPQITWFVFAVSTGLILYGCGGGSTSTPPPEAVVTQVTNAQVLEGDAQASLLEFVVELNKPVERSVVVNYSTLSTNQPTGFAKGGDACGPDVDYISVTNKAVTIAAGSNTGKLTVTVCSDTVFEPNETLKISWLSAGAVGGTAVGTIINDDAGGLNSTGSTAQLAGLAAFGRDSHPLTRSSADGALGFSFVAAGGCVTDKVTGLTWQKSDNSIFLNKAYSDLTAYVSAVNADSLCGYSDWRVPSANELMNLMDISKVSGQTANADSNISGNMTGVFWSSEVTVPGTVDAWLVDASSNGVISYARKEDAKQVRLVRGGTPTNATCSATGYSDHQDGTVSDNRSGLMWKKCPEGYSDNSCSTGTRLTFSSPSTVATQLVKVNTAMDKGYSDWRVPTRNELASLVNRACFNPAIFTGIFPATESLAYITSSLNSNAPTSQIWSVDFNGGNVSPDVLSRGYLLRLVRAGQ